MRISVNLRSCMAGGIALAVALTVSISDLSGQTVPLRGAVATGVAFETYEFLDPEEVGLRRVSLLSLPFGVYAEPMPRFGLSLNGAFARGSVERLEEPTATISGLTDTVVQLAYTVGRDLLVISAGYLFPTGHSTHTPDEAEVAGIIAADLLPFRVSNWGSGGGLGINTAVAVPVGGFGLGMSVGYTVAREFDALELTDDTWTYRPGNELRLRFGVDRTVGPASKAALVLNVQRFAEDRLQGENLYQPGNRFDIIGSYSFAAGPGTSGIGYLGWGHRDAAVFALDNQQLPAQDLILIGGGLRVPLNNRVLVPVAEVRTLRREDGFQQSHLGSLGASLEWPFGRATVIPTVRGRFGTILLWEGETASVRGVELGFSVRTGVGPR